MRLLEEHPERVGYLLKERVFDVAVLVDALRRIADGETVVDPTIVSRLLGRRRREDPLDELTEREREVLGLRRRGPAPTARSRRALVRHRAHGRGARQADLLEARARRESRLAPPRPRRARPESRRTGKVVASRALEICRDRIRRESGTARPVAAASVLQASGVRGDAIVFRPNENSLAVRISRNTAARVYTTGAAHSPEVAGSNPVPATSKSPGDGAFRLRVGGATGARASVKRKVSVPVGRLFFTRRLVRLRS